MKGREATLYFHFYIPANNVLIHLFIFYLSFWLCFCMQLCLLNCTCYDVVEYLQQHSYASSSLESVSDWNLKFGRRDSNIWLIWFTCRAACFYPQLLKPLFPKEAFQSCSIIRISSFPVCLYLQLSPNLSQLALLAPYPHDNKLNIPRWNHSDFLFSASWFTPSQLSIPIPIVHSLYLWARLPVKYLLIGALLARGISCSWTWSMIGI